MSDEKEVDLYTEVLESMRSKGHDSYSKSIPLGNAIFNIKHKPSTRPVTASVGDGKEPLIGCGTFHAKRLPGAE